MKLERTGFGRIARALAMFALLVIPLGAMAVAVRADDVPDAARDAYVAGARLLAKGDAKSLQKAFETLDPHKDQALGSVNYWEVYARVWLGLKKSETELWDSVVAPRQLAAPKSVVFDLVRARLAEDADKRRAAIEAALKRDPKSVPARVARAVLHLDEDEEDEADELLEAILEDAPNDEGACLAMAGLLLSDGLPGDAIEYCDQGLKSGPSAALHHLKAQCYKRMAKNKPDAINKALASSAEALGLEPSETHIATFNELLKRTGDAKAAAKALRTHFERTKHPMLGAMLAENAFKTGDYEGTILGLSAGDQSDIVTIKALAVAHARLGKAAEARKAAARVLELDSQGRLFAARLDLFLGDAASAQKRLGSLADAQAKRLRALAHAWAGEPDKVKALVAKEVAKGSRDGDALLVAWLQAQVLARMDASLADAMRKKVLKARFANGQKQIDQAHPVGVDIGKAKTAGWPRRCLTYFRSRCGTFFKATGDTGFSSTWSFGDGEVTTISRSVHGESECGADKVTCSFSFNARETKTSGRGWIRVLTEGDKEELGDFAPAEKAYAAGCAAYVKGDLKTMEAEWAKALKVEPNWSRIKVVRAVIRALSPDGEKRHEAKTAKEQLKLWTDDFELRRLVNFVGAWVGDVDLQKSVDALAKSEAQYNVRNLSAL